jgi:hypothetical protein
MDVNLKGLRQDALPSMAIIDEFYCYFSQQNAILLAVFELPSQLCSASLDFR